MTQQLIGFPDVFSRFLFNNTLTEQWEYVRYLTLQPTSCRVCVRVRVGITRLRLRAAQGIFLSARPSTPACGINTCRSTMSTRKM